jgi:hypothetical protein
MTKDTFGLRAQEREREAQRANAADQMVGIGAAIIALLWIGSLL